MINLKNASKDSGMFDKYIRIHHKKTERQEQELYLFPTFSRETQG